MPHTSFCLRDKGHFSKRNIRSLFLVLIPRTACHNAFTFCPYIRFFSAGAVLLRKGCKLFSWSVPGSQQWGCLWAGACVGRAFLAPLSRSHLAFFTSSLQTYGNHLPKLSGWGHFVCPTHHLLPALQPGQPVGNASDHSSLPRSARGSSARRLAAL